MPVAPLLTNTERPQFADARIDAQGVGAGLVFVADAGISGAHPYDFVSGKTGKFVGSTAYTTLAGVPVWATANQLSGVQFPHSAALDRVAKQLTILIWASVAVEADYARLIEQPYYTAGATGAPYVTWSLTHYTAASHDSGTLGVGFGGAYHDIPSGSTYVSAGDPLTCYAVTYDVTTGKTVFYRNGAFYSSTTGATNAAFDPGQRGPLNILVDAGVGGTGAQNGTQGAAARAYVFDRLLSGAQVGALYKNPQQIWQPPRRWFPVGMPATVSSTVALTGTANAVGSAAGKPSLTRRLSGTADLVGTAAGTPFNSVTLTHQYTATNLALDSAAAVYGGSNLRSAGGLVYLNYNRPAVDANHVLYTRLESGSGTTALDDSATANNGTLSAGDPEWATAYSGNGAAFFATPGYSNSTEYIDYGAILAYEHTQPFSAWVAGQIYALPPAGGAEIIYTNCHDATNHRGHELWIDDAGHLHTRIISVFPSAYIGVHGSTNVCDGNWHTIGFTYDGTGVAAGVTLYVDGFAETPTTESDNLAGATIISPSNIWIGNQNGWPYSLNGSLDNFRFYNALQPSSFFTTTYKTAVPPATLANTQLACDFEETSGTTVIDTSGNGRNGTASDNRILTAYKLGSAAVALRNTSGGDISFPTNAAYDLGSTLTAVAWAENANAAGTAGPLFQHVNSSSPFPGWAFHPGYSGTLQYYDGANFQNSTITPPAGLHCWAVRLNGGTLDFFIDGTSVKTLTGIPSPTAAAATPLLLGYWPGVGEWLGLLSNAHVSNIARSDAYMAQFAKAHPASGVASLSSPSTAIASGGGDYGSLVTFTNLAASFATPTTTGLQYRIGTSSSSAAAATTAKLAAGWSTLTASQTLSQTGRWLDFDVKFAPSTDTIARDTPTLSSLSVTYTSSATTVALAGTGDGIGTAGGSPLLTRVLFGTPDIIGTGTGAPTLKRLISGAPDLVGAAAGQPKLTRTLSGTADSTGKAAGLPRLTRLLQGALAAVGTSGGRAAVTLLLAALTAATGTSAGEPHLTRPLSGVAGAEAGAGGSVALTRALAGTGDGVGTGGGLPHLTRGLNSTAAGVGGGAGQPALTRTLAALAGAIGTAAGLPHGSGAFLVAAAAALGSAEGMPQIDRVLFATAAALAAAAGEPILSRTLAGLAQTSGSGSGAIRLTRTIQTTANLVGMAAGAPHGTGAYLVATALALGGSGGEPLLARELFATGVALGAASGQPLLTREIAALADAIGKGAGGAKLSRQLVATAAAVGQGLGAPHGAGAYLVAVALSTGLAAGTPHLTRALSQLAQAVGDGSGLPQLARRLTAVSTALGATGGSPRLGRPLTGLAHGVGDAGGQIVLTRPLAGNADLIGSAAGRTLIICPVGGRSFAVGWGDGQPHLAHFLTGTAQAVGEGFALHGWWQGGTLPQGLITAPLPAPLLPIPAIVPPLMLETIPTTMTANLIFYASDDLSVPIQVMKSDGSGPQNITGYSATFLLKVHTYDDDSFALLTIPGVMYNEAQGVFTFSLTSAQTADLSGTYTYLVKTVDPVGTQKTVLAGSALVRRG